MKAGSAAGDRLVRGAAGFLAAALLKRRDHVASRMGVIALRPGERACRRGARNRRIDRSRDDAARLGGIDDHDAGSAADHTGAVGCTEALGTGIARTTGTLIVAAQVRLVTLRPLERIGYGATLDWASTGEARRPAALAARIRFLTWETPCGGRACAPMAVQRPSC